MSVEVNRGGLSFTARIDTSQLEKDSKRVEKIISDQAKKSEKDFSRITKNLSNQSKQIVSDASQAFDQLDPKYKRLFTNLQLYASQLDKLKLAQKELNTQLKDGTITQGQYNKALAGIRAEASQVTKAMKELGAESQFSGRIQQQRWDGLGNSIAQVTRELPAFTYSAQTGFMAISNNIPILADEIARLRVRNEQLTASGQKAVPVWQQVLKGFLSWQTVLSVGITLLTVYGKEIGAFIKGLFSSKDAIDQTRQSQEALSKAFSSGEMSKAIESISDLRTNLNLAKEGLIDKQTVIDQYNESLGKVTTQARDLKDVEQGLIDNADNYVKATLYKAAADSAKEDIGKRLLENAKEKLEAEQKLIDAQNELAEAQEKRQKRFVFTPSGQAIETATLEENDVAYYERKVELAEKANEKIVNSGNKLIEALKKQSLATGIDLFSEDPKVIDTLSKRKDLLEEIAKLDKEYARIKLDDNQAEIQALKDKFQRVRELINEFNSDPKNAKVQIQVEALDSIEAEAQKNLIFKQETQSLVEEYEKRKTLFQEYESFITDFGEAEARKRYGDQIELAKEYLKGIQDQFNSINLIPNEERSFSQNQRLNAFKKILDKEEKEQELAYLRSIKAFIDFNEKRKILEEVYQKQRAEIIRRGDLSYLEEFDRQFKEQQQKLNDEAFRKGSGLNEFFANIETMARDKALAEIKRLREEIEKFDQLNLEEGGISDELVNSIKLALSNIESNINKEIPAGMIKWAGALDEIGRELAGVDAQLSQIISSVSNAVKGFAQIKGLMADLKLAKDTNNQAAEFTAMAGLISAAATSLIGIFNLVAKSARQRKETEEKYYKSIIGLQREYNLALNEQIRLRSEADGNVFMTDFKGKLDSGYEALLDAEGKYNEALEKLSDARVKIGTRNKIDLGSAVGSTALGAIAGTAIGAIATGAAIGSIVPGIGTIIGAGVGAIVGLFATKKKKNTYGSLLEEFPELVKEGTNGLLEINRELAEALIANDLLDDSTKSIVENVLQWEEAVRDARKQIAEVIGDLVGQIGGDLQNVLVEAFRAGEDAAEAMASTVEKAIERMIQSLAFGVAFKDAFDQYQKDLIESLDPLTGDQNTLDDSRRFLDNLMKGRDLYNQLLEDAQKAAEEYGFDIFKPENISQQRGLAGAIRRELTEETGNELAGLFRGSFDLAKRQLIVAQDSLQVQVQIEKNTYLTVQELKLSNSRLEMIVKNTKGGSSRDLGLDD